MQSQIIKLLKALEESEEIIGKCACEDLMDDVIGCEKKLFKCVGKIEGVRDIYDELDKANYDYHRARCLKYYREGFINGARIALEICGVEFTDEV